MITRHFRSDRLLRSLYGTEACMDYCRERSIDFEQAAGAVMREEDLRRWAAALGKLPREKQVAVELELAKVNELSDRDSASHLVEALQGRELPPELPGEAALALWCLVHHPDTFREVFLRQEIADVDAWRSAQAQAHIAIENFGEKSSALADTLKEFFRLREGAGRFCAVDAYRLDDCWCFAAIVADRLQLFEGFTDGGEHTTEPLRPAFPVTFVYYPEDGTILLQSRLRAAERILDLFQRFGRSVLGVELPESCVSVPFDLEPLKRDFRFLPDAPDMESARVKALHLRSGERARRRQLKLETLSGDDVSAIQELLGVLVPGALDGLQVCYAELQVKLKVEGQGKSYPIRLWPNRSNLPQTPLGERFRSCLKRWGLSHAAKS